MAMCTMSLEHVKRRTGLLLPVGLYWSMHEGIGIALMACSFNIFFKSIQSLFVTNFGLVHIRIV